MGKEEEGSEVKKVVLGKYGMGQVLGKGTFAKVYYSWNLRSGDSMTIKVISKDQVRPLTGGWDDDQIQREISMMRMVCHPNMVELKEKFGD